MDIENVKKMYMRLEYAKENVSAKKENNKRKYPTIEERERAKRTVEKIAQEISDMLNDPDISEDVRKSMANESGKQLALIRKEIAKLQTLLKTAE